MEQQRTHPMTAAGFRLPRVVTSGMDIDEDKIDDAVLALLWLTLHNERCAWKGFDWATTDRLHKKGMIADPVNKSKSLVLTDEGLERSEALFRALFTIAVVFSFHCHGSNSCRREAGRSAMRARTSASQALGSTSFNRAVVMRVAGIAGAAI
ncbi:hypothetical protein SAMN05518861_11759 [Mesorhizobium sp. YR577]|nr:hypothetical protein SAMN05518861_11759 [Mesorhizobium sp. YR577]